jgi:hypothetical protein
MLPRTAFQYSLAIDPTAYVFGKQYESQLRQRLAEFEKGTQLSPIMDGNGVLLQEDGTTVGTKHRYTTVALNQMCQLLAPGLAQLLFDLVGRNRRPDQPKGEFGLRTAVEVFNQIARFRRNRIKERQLVRFLPGKTVDGIVGPKYRYLSNLGFYDRVKDAVGSKAQFHEALLYGRYLVLRYVLPSRRFVYSTGVSTRVESFVPGFHFVNSEIGEGSARAAVLFVRESTGETCIGPFTGRVKHQGRDFDAKLSKLMLTVDHRIESADYYRERIGHLLARKLGLGKGDKEDEKTKKAIVAVLVKQGLQQSMADKVLAATVMTGSGYHVGDPLLIARQHLVLAGRTAYDVFTALMREAHALSVNAREAVEQVAYALLVGRFTFD